MIKGKIPSKRQASKNREKTDWKEKSKKERKTTREHFPLISKEELDFGKP